MHYNRILMLAMLWLICFKSIANDLKQYQLNIDGGNTAQSLSLLAEQADLLILFPFDLVIKQQSSPLVGKYTITQALKIILEGSGLQSISNANGLYKIRKIPKPKPKIKATIVDTQFASLLEEIDEKSQQEQTEIISVVGRLSPFEQQFLQHRYSHLLVENLSLKNTKKYTQRNIGELLQNASGTSTDYRKREGLFLTVRGFGPELNAVLYNNRQLPNTNIGSGFSFDTLSSDMFISSDIYKTQTTELVSGGIGATINLVNLPTTGKDHYKLAGGVKFSASDNGLYFPELFGSLTYSSENFASVFSINLLKEEYRLESANSDGWFEADLSGVPLKEGGQDYSKIWVPRNFDLRIEQGEKKRFGVSWANKIDLGPDVSIMTDILYSKFDVLSNITSSGNWTHINGNPEALAEKDTFASVSVDNNQTLLSYRYKDNLSLASDFVKLIRNRPSETLHIGTAVSYDLNLATNLRADLSYAIAKSDNGGKRRFSAVGSPNANPQYTLSPGQPYANIRYQNQMQASDLRSHITVNSGDDVKDTIFQFKLDSETLLTNQNWESVNAGFYFADRRKEKLAFSTPWGGEFGGYEFDLPDTFFREIDASGFLNGGVPEIWYDFDSQQYIDYLWSDEHIQQAIIDTGHPLKDTILLRKQLGQFTATELLNSTWEITENLFEAYVKGIISGQVANHLWTGQIGIRISATNINASGYDQAIQDLTFSETDPTSLIITYAQATPIKQKNHYINWLPSFNFKVNLSEDKSLKFGLSKTISRPSLNKLAPSIGEFRARAGSSTAIRGNPQLQPYESINLDFGWAWYFDANGLLDLTLYYKNVDNFIMQNVQLERLLDHQEGEFLVATPINLDRTSFYGYEFIYQNQFESFAAPFNGMGIELRYTHVDADPLEVNSSIRENVIEGLSDTYSAVLYMDYKQFSGSLVYNHRDEFVRKQSGLQGQPEMVEEYGQLDIKLRYQFPPNFEVFFDVQNLTKTTPRSFSLYQERLLSYEQYQRVFTLGVNLQF